MRTLGALFTCVCLAACSVTPVEVPGPNGRPAFSMDCSNVSLEDCYRKAGEICLAGYDILDHATSVVGTRDVVVTLHSLLIECKRTQEPDDK